MSGFSNAVVGGVGKLVRKWIQSPDYVPETSGWTVNQDGSAEFNDVTIRGIVVIEGSSGELFAYRGTPGLGSLVCAIAGQSGSDSYGNVYQEGITLPSSLTGNPVGQITFADSLSTAAVARSPFMADFTVAGVSSDLKVKGATDDIINHQPASIDLTFGIAPNPPWTVAQIIGDRVQLTARNGGNGQIELVGPVQVGAGRIGEYYYEEVALSQTQNYPNSTYTKPVGMTSQVLYSDYGSQWNLATGVWTCPVSGIYTFTINVLFTYAVANTRFIVIGQHNNVSTNVSDLISQNGNYTLTYNRYVDAGETYNVLINQGSGATRQLKPYSYIGIRRAL